MLLAICWHPKVNFCLYGHKVKSCLNSKNVNYVKKSLRVMK